MTACGGERVFPGDQAMTVRPIEEVLGVRTPALMALPGVVGTAQGLCQGRPCIMIYVTRKTPELAREVPQSLDGYPVVVEETGKFEALPGS